MGTNFWSQQKALITLPTCCRFKKKTALKSNFIYIFFHVSPYVYSPRQGQTIHWGQNFDDNRKAFSLCPYVASFKRSLRNLILYTFLMILYMYIAPGQGEKTPWGKLLMSTESPYHFDHLLQVSNKSLWILILYTFLMFFHMYIALGQGQTTLCGQNQQKSLVTLPICCKFKKIYLWSPILYIIFHVFIHVYSPWAGADNPL